MKLTLENKLLPVLRYLYESKNRISIPTLSKWQKQAGKKLKANILLEIDSIKKDPISVANKILKINPAFYIHSLGEGLKFSLKFKIKYFLLYILNKFDNFLNFFFPNLVFLKPQKSVLVDDIFKSIKSNIPTTNKFFIYCHLMDVHDRGFVNRPIRFLQKIFLWPLWFYNKKTNKTFKRFLYDISLHFIDIELGKLINLPKLNSCKFFIFGDHGCDIHDIEKRKVQEVFGFRTHMSILMYL